MDDDRATALVHGTVEVIDGTGRRSAMEEERIAEQRRKAMDIGTTYAALASFCSMYTSATLMRREAFDEVGGYDEALDVYEDWDLYLRLSAVGTLTYFDAPAARYRVWEGNVSWDRTARGIVEVARKHLRGLSPDGVDARDAAFGFQTRMAASHYTLLEVREARKAALAALRLHPGQALASRDVRRSLTRWVLPRSILQHRRPPRTEP
jgi:GT2 family glycosyltransferase